MYATEQERLQNMDPTNASENRNPVQEGSVSSEMTINLDTVKKYFVNLHRDQANDGVQELLNQVDPNKYTFWFLNYDKFGSEGQKMTPFTNLLMGFEQAFMAFRNLSFGKLCILGEEPNLQIQGVFLMKGTTLPAACTNVDQFEYMKARQIEIESEGERELVREFMTAEAVDTTCDEGQQCFANGMPVRVVVWQK